jgi:chaperonin cofactor prefoldin
MPTKEASVFSRSLDDNNLNKYYIQIKDFFFDLEDKYSTAMDRIRRDKKMAEKQGQDWIISSLDKEEMNVKYHLRKNIDKLRGRVNTLEREMKNRRNVVSNY